MFTTGFPLASDAVFPQGVCTSHPEPWAWTTVVTIPRGDTTTRASDAMVGVGRGGSGGSVWGPRVGSGNADVEVVAGGSVVPDDAQRRGRRPARLILHGERRADREGRPEQQRHQSAQDQSRARHTSIVAGARPLPSAGTLSR